MVIFCLINRCAYHVNAKIDAVEPLALLALEAAVRGTPELVPRWNSGDGYIHGTYLLTWPYI